MFLYETRYTSSLDSWALRLLQLLPEAVHDGIEPIYLRGWTSHMKKKISNVHIRSLRNTIGIIIHSKHTTLETRPDLFLGKINFVKTVKPRRIWYPPPDGKFSPDLTCHTTSHRGIYMEFTTSPGQDPLTTSGVTTSA